MFVLCLINYSFIIPYLHLQHPETGEKHPLSNPLTKTQSIEIYDPVIVYPKRLVLLWDTKGETYYQHSMKVRYIHDVIRDVERKKDT